MIKILGSITSEDERNASIMFKLENIKHRWGARLKTLYVTADSMDELKNLSDYLDKYLLANKLMS